MVLFELKGQGRAEGASWRRSDVRGDPHHRPERLRGP